MGEQSKNREYILTFENGLRCRYIVPGKPVAGQEYRPRIIWDGGKPTPDEYPKYRDWINDVSQSLANEWKIDLMHVFMLGPNRHEVWAYHPGGKPTPVADVKL